LESKEQIAQAAESLFLSYGVRSVTMDDISKKLAISKKTIYQYYRDKDEIVCLVTERVMEREQHQINQIKNEATDAIHELILITNYIRQHSQNINPSVLFDIQKYHRNAWEIYIKFKESVFLNSLTDTLKRGVAEGFFRKEINIDVLAILRLEQVQMAYDEEVYARNKFDFREVQIQLFKHFVYGILTVKGIETLESYQEKFFTNES